MSGKVYLVGAGPGDPGLLTVRAVELLRTAEVVAHDALIPDAILALVNPSAERLAVGRRHGMGETSYRLHPDVLARARDGRRVVRLKAGDPMIFGRGGEEAEELAAAGIPFEVVPGITAALGAAASAGIPLTHRDRAQDVTFVTGHGVDGTHAGDGRTEARWDAIAAGSGTVVLYMAGRKLGACARRLVKGGRADATPVAVVVNATQESERVVVGTLSDVTEKVGRLGEDDAAVVIVGDVVGARVEEASTNTRTSTSTSTSGRGLIMVYTGDGKGKTTAALGMVFRAMGKGLKAGVVQFIKGKWKTGERVFAETLPELTFLVMGRGFTWESDDLSRDRKAAQQAWATARELVSGGRYDLVVLDELTYAIHYGFVDLAEVIATLRDRPSHVHVVVTGRRAPAELVNLAELVTDMTPIKHPYQQGIPAQPGIDF